MKTVNNHCNDPCHPTPVDLIPAMACDDSNEILMKMIKNNDCTFSDMTFEIVPNML
jgi:hypothetical protein